MDSESNAAINNFQGGKNDNSKTCFRSIRPHSREISTGPKNSKGSRRKRIRYGINEGEEAIKAQSRIKKFYVKAARKPRDITSEKAAEEPHDSPEAISSIQEKESEVAPDEKPKPE